MPDAYKLREVFSRGMPTVTYVHREHLGLERRLQDAVAKGHAIVAITGPSKCGKTVLRRKVIPDNCVVKIEGGQITTESDFWDAIRTHVGAVAARSESATKQVGGTAGISGEIHLGIAKIGGNYGESDGSSRSETRSYTGPQKSELLAQLIAMNDVLVVDDFHYIPERIRSSIVRALKSAVFDGLCVVMLSVPYRAFDVLSAEAEMEGRFSHLPILAWRPDDLLKIAEQGFPAMGLEVGLQIARSLAEEALGSPLLMQSLCAELCIQLDVTSTKLSSCGVGPDDVDLPQLYAAIARDFGLPSFQKLSAGPQSRTDRIPRRFVNGNSGDIYEAVLAAIAYSGAGEQTSYDDLRAALREILSKAVPQKHEVTRSILQMCGIAKKMQVKSAMQRDAEAEDAIDTVEIPPIDWKDDQVMINDVFLRFYLRWEHRPAVAPIRTVS